MAKCIHKFPYENKISYLKRILSNKKINTSDENLSMQEDHIDHKHISKKILHSNYLEKFQYFKNIVKVKPVLKRGKGNKKVKNV